MSLKVYKISDYTHRVEEKQFESIRQFLSKHYAFRNEDAILIGNYNIEGVELDALLIAPGGYRILEFKNWGGDIIARENGSWTSNGKIIEGGSGKKTPYEQIRQNKSRVTKGLGTLLGATHDMVSAAIIFWQKSNIDKSQISSTVSLWLHIFDNQHLENILEGMNNSRLTNVFIRSIPEKLKIEEFDIDKQKVSQSVPDEIYEPEAATNFFEELEYALRSVPDYESVYDSLNRVFQMSLNQKTAGSRLNLGGTFAKLDYILKEMQASKALYRAINDTRNRLRKRDGYSELELKDNYLYDLKNICKFISFIYNAEIPKSLSDVFPADREKASIGSLVGEYLRVIVEQWDDEYVWVQTEEDMGEEMVKVCYAHNRIFQDTDWSYLKGFFYAGAQLNLIRPRVEENVIYPELIIFEPDYLINISTVARCFTNYADSPFVDLIKKIEPVKSSQAIELGNFAGQLLDEEIHQLPNTHSYNQSVKDFFKGHAINLLSAGIDKNFHTEAQNQKRNITQALRVDLPPMVSRFNPREGMVEPSFVSEMLGLQGRMDYLQLDYKILFEQKSGRGAFPYDDFIKPRSTEEHLIQLTLYMLLIRYNYRERYEKNKQELHAFLLYSKYKESLLNVGFYPQEICKAIQVRNGLAYVESLYTKENGFRILESLTPDLLNMKKADNPLWVRFQRPLIEEVLAPMKKASDLEKDYFFRFMTFIANEQTLSKIGSKTKENSGFASIWYDSLDEKKLAGNIYDNLTLVSPNDITQGSIEKVILSYSETKENDMSNFRIGDIVILYPYEKGKEPDARKTMVLKCSIEERTTDKIVLKLRAPQSDSRVFLHEKGKLWAIEPDFMESSYSSLYKGMYAFLSAPKTRRDLLLMQREPETDASVTLKLDHGKFNDLAQKVKAAKDFFLIIGPPGTGKTSFGLMTTLLEELAEEGTSVLLLSYTNRAVDEICSKLKKEGLDFIRIGVEQSCGLEYRDNLLSIRAQNCQNLDQLRDIIQKGRIFVGTTTSLNASISLFRLKQFSLAIIDEASQILEPHLIGLLSAHNNGVPAIRKFVMIGDHKQLPAVVQQEPKVSRVHNVKLNEIGLMDCRLSLFERLLNKYGRDDSTTRMLTQQGRMHHEIALFPNYTFYENRLEEVPGLDRQLAKLPLEGIGRNGIDDLLRTRRVVFLDAERPQPMVSEKVNLIEAEMIAATVLRILEMEKEDFNPDKTVGVIVPYRNQIAAVRSAIDNKGTAALHNITIDTVERYQGSQRKYIIYGFTVQKYYQLNFLTGNSFEDDKGNIIDRKLNVAMTRAEEHLILVGNSELLANNFTFFKLIEFIRSKQGFFKIGKDEYVTGNFKIPQYHPEELSISDAVFSVSPLFKKAFDKHIVTPLKEMSDDNWPKLVMGHDMATNLNLIGYGRINFSDQLQIFGGLSPQEQVLLYCYYIMRQHYCSSCNLLSSYSEWLNVQIKGVHGRVHLIDIGCGPATCGAAFAEQFLDMAPNMVYTGIDVSASMKNMGKCLIDEMFDGRLNYQWKESLGELKKDFWEGCSETSSLVIFNMSYFFSNVKAEFAEGLARQIVEIIKTYSLNRYVFLIQHSECDHNLNSYKVFRRVLSTETLAIKEEKASFSYQLGYKEQHLPFFYDILTNK